MLNNKKNTTKAQEYYYTFAAFKKDFPTQAAKLLVELASWDDVTPSAAQVEQMFVQRRITLKVDYTLGASRKQPHISLFIQSTSYCWAYGAGGVGAGWSID